MNNLMNILKIVILSATPIIEQKVAIPTAYLMRSFDLWQIYLITLLGALLPSPFILLLMPKIIELFKKVKYINKLVFWYEKHALKKGKNIVKYELLGLFLFVAIPLPGTGVWTGSTVASLLKLDFKKSLLVVALGAAVCGFIIMVLTFGVSELFA